MGGNKRKHFEEQVNEILIKAVAHCPVYSIIYYVMLQNCRRNSVPLYKV